MQGHTEVVNLLGEGKKGYGGEGKKEEVSKMRTKAWQGSNNSFSTSR